VQLKLLALALSAGWLLAADLSVARKLYDSTRYQQSLQALQGDASVAALQLAGQNWYYLEDYKKAIESLESAIAREPANSDLHAWLGRAWGRRAETGNPLAAPRAASKARQYFEKAVELNPKNILALNDLFEYYLQAPGFLGGGKDKAARAAAQIAALDKAEGHYADARLAEDRKDYPAAEQSLRRAIEAAPGQVGRILDLAKFLARRGRTPESEAEFAKAEKIAPNSPKLWFDRASIYAEGRRNTEAARELLKRYLNAPLTPDDPPRREAERLLRSL
jgi:tetratricopeptide (TPR) repeat protein